MGRKQPADRAAAKGHTPYSRLGAQQAAERAAAKRATAKGRTPYCRRGAHTAAEGRARPSYRLEQTPPH